MDFSSSWLSIYFRSGIEISSFRIPLVVKNIEIEPLKKYCDPLSSKNLWFLLSFSNRGVVVLHHYFQLLHLFTPIFSFSILSTFRCILCKKVNIFHDALSLTIEWCLIPYLFFSSTTTKNKRTIFIHGINGI